MIFPTKDALTKIISHIRNRALKLRASANVTIYIIIFILIAGIGAFYLAGVWANNDAYQLALNKRAFIDSKIEEIKKLINENEKKVDSLNKQIEIDSKNNKVLDNQLNSNIAQGNINANVAQDITKKASADNKSPVLITSEQVRAEAMKNREDLIKSLAQWQDQQFNLISESTSTGEPAGSSSAKPNQISVLISAIATRVGAIILLIFLVQILVPLYRYNIKLAAYYDARADILELLEKEGTQEIDESMIEMLVPIFSPENMDFGTGPNSPTEQIVDLAKHILSSQK
jgi:hypothetical protein